MLYEFKGKPDDRVSAYQTGKVYDLTIEEQDGAPCIVYPTYCPYGSKRAFSRNWRAVTRLEVFVYGTLKQGFHNHRICEHAVVEVIPATLVGALYRGPGFPYLRVPEETVITMGKAAFAKEPERQQVSCFPKEVMFGEKVQAAIIAEPTDAWGFVSGEILAFHDPDILRSLDRLEGFRPGEAWCHYHRVLVPAKVGEDWRPVWVYTAANDMGEHAVRIASGEWTGKGY